MHNSKIEAAASDLIEDLKSQETKTKINAIKSLSIIALTIGKERTRNELLPYLEDSIDEEDEESLIELAKVLSSFLDYVGGMSHAGSLFRLLETLISSDDYVVRKEGLISFKFILSQVNPIDHEVQLIELIKKLSRSEYTHHKTSSLNLISYIFPFFNSDNKKFLKSCVTNLIKEEPPIIRKELSIAIKDLTMFLEIDFLCNLLQNLQKDTNDSVRIFIMDGIASLKLNSEVERSYAFISGILTTLSRDESWRVRLTVADKIHELFTFPNLPDYLKQNAIEIFASLISDKEGETRNKCCIRLESMAELVGKTNYFDKILIELRKIEKDYTYYVRSSLASSLLRIAPLVGKIKTNDYIFPIFLNMINDESHDIRMILIKNLDRLHEVINIDMYVQTIIPSLLEIASNKSWRVRLQITESIPVIARILNKNLFMENIFSFCIGWLTDDVYAIREVGWKLMKKLYDLFKCEEFEKRLIEKLSEMKSNNNYLIRNTVIMLAKEFASDEFEIDFVEKKMTPLIFKLSRDKISNVRVNAAILLKKISRLIKSKEINREVYLHIEELKRDSDIEVIYAISDN